MVGISFLGYIGGALTTAAGFPQITKMIETKETKDLSWGMIFCWVVGLSMTTTYGFIIKKKPVYAAGIASLAMTVNMAALKLNYEVILPYCNRRIENDNASDSNV